MRLRKKFLAVLLCVGSMSLFTGCSVTEVMDKLLGHASQQEKEEVKEEVNEEAEDVQAVDENMDKPVFSADLEGSFSYEQGEEAEPLSIEAEVSDGGEISYQWYSNNVESNGGGTPIEGATEASFVPSTEEVGTFYYYVVATNTLNGSIAKATSGLASVEIKEPVQGKWIQDKTGWWYQLEDGTYPSNGWMKIKGKWYFFGEYGYMKTGWLKDGDYWYYLQKDGSMAQDTTIDGYTIDESGHWIK